jgi:hypothetical protein
MTSTQKRVFLILLLLSAFYLVLFYFTSASGVRDIKMVMAFEPDEGVPLGYVFAMIRPADSVKESLKNFAFYNYYFYGYPYFAYSALALLPLKLAGQLDNTPLVMVTLRQVVSVLPILLTILLLVYLQTRFRSYWAVALFLFLASIPAVTSNNFWWHPDGLSILLSMLVIFFLVRDDLRFGPNFFLAALMTGFSAGTKGIGFFFFLTILVYLLWGLLAKRIGWGRMALSAAGFVALLALGYLIANPILIFESVRRRYFQVVTNQSGFLIAGYEIYVERGPAAAYRMSQLYYGHWVFMLVMYAACIWGILRDRSRRLLYTVILTWNIPITLLAMSVIHFKFQYWLPVMLPLFSCVLTLLPERKEDGPVDPIGRQYAEAFTRSILVLVVLAQFSAFVQTDVALYERRLSREQTAPSIAFYEKALSALQPLPPRDYYVYHETRMYVPDTPGWTTESLLEVLSYPYIHGSNFDVVMIMQQRVADYLNESAVGIDPESFALGQTFYRDVRAESVDGYQLVYKDSYGLVFVRSDLYEEYW